MAREYVGDALGCIKAIGILAVGLIASVIIVFGVRDLMMLRINEHLTVGHATAWVILVVLIGVPIISVAAFVVLGCAALVKSTSDAIKRSRNSG